MLDFSPSVERTLNTFHHYWPSFYISSNNMYVGKNGLASSLMKKYRGKFPITYTDSFNTLASPVHLGLRLTN